MIWDMRACSSLQKHHQQVQPYSIYARETDVGGGKASYGQSDRKQLRLILVCLLYVLCSLRRCALQIDKFVVVTSIDVAGSSFNRIACINIAVVYKLTCWCGTVFDKY